MRKLILLGVAGLVVLASWMVDAQQQDIRRGGGGSGSTEIVTNGVGISVSSNSSIFTVSHNIGVADSKLTLYTNGGQLVLSNSAPASSGSSYITPMAVTLTTISNSVVETDVLSVTITNNTFTTGKTLRIRLWGDFIKNTGGTETTTNMVKLGSTYMYKDSIGNMVNSANNRMPIIELDLYAVSNTSQTVRFYTVYGTGGAADIGDGDGAQSSVQRINTYSGTASEDMTSGNKTFSFAVNFSGANTALYWRPIQATALLINAP